MRTLMHPHGTLSGYTRRQLIGSAGAAAGTLLLPGIASGRGTRAATKSRFWTPGIQLYTLGDAPRIDLAGTLRRVARLGYRRVELPGDYGRAPQELRRALTVAGLTCPAIHVLPQATPGAWHLDGDIGALAANVRALGADRAVVAIAPLPDQVRQAFLHPPAGGPDPAVLDGLVRALTRDDWKRAAALLNDRAARLAASGVALAYHNHAFEFVPLPGGGTGYDLLLAETDPALVSFELDVGWVAAAGQDVVELLERTGRRVTMMHLKDAAGISRNVIEMAPADVGTGIVPWRALAGAIRRVGIDQLYFEQEPPFPASAFASAAVARTWFDGLFGERPPPR